MKITCDEAPIDSHQSKSSVGISGRLEMERLAALPAYVFSAASMILGASIERSPHYRLLINQTPRLAGHRQLVLRAGCEVARVVALVQLLRQLAIKSVDDAPALDRRALNNGVGPALDVDVVLDR
ncbi:MAG TPA: hypothetical protein VIO94_06320 [Phenylobacterium sp.]